MLRAQLPIAIARLPPGKFSPRIRLCSASTTMPSFVPINEKDGLSGETPKEGFSFRLVSYNILAQVYVKSSYFPHSPSPCLRWKARSQAVLSHLTNLDADFLCLQELDEFDSFYQKNMAREGYLSIYIQRPGQKRDGCGIFYKPTSAELLIKETIQYNDLVDILTKSESSNCVDSGSEDSNSPKEENDGGRDPNDPKVRLKRDCVGIMAAFRLNDPSGHLTIVANTHIYWDPDWADVKLAQVQYLLLRLSKFRTHVSEQFNTKPSVIVAGDFNSTPGDNVYQFMVSGNAAATAAKLPQDLCSLYAWAGEEPPFTNCTPGFTGTLDYIFFLDSCGLKPIRILQIPGPQSPDIIGGLPNYQHPSDHLPIGGDFVVADH